MTPEEREKLTPEALKTLDLSDQLELVRTSRRLDLHREIAINISLHLARLEEALGVARAGTFYEDVHVVDLEAKLKAALEELEIARAAAKIDGSCFVAMDAQLKAALKERDEARKEAKHAHEQAEGLREKVKVLEGANDSLSRSLGDVRAERDAAQKEAHEDREQKRKALSALRDTTEAREHSVAREAEAARLLQEIREECGTLRAQLAEATNAVEGMAELIGELRPLLKRSPAPPTSVDPK